MVITTNDIKKRIDPKMKKVPVPTRKPAQKSPPMPQRKPGAQGMAEASEDQYFRNKAKKGYAKGGKVKKKGC